MPRPDSKGIADRAKDFLYSDRGAFLRPAHKALINVMVAGVGLRDSLRFRRPADPHLAEVATIAVKTFERPDAIARFVRSARRVFGGRIVVAHARTPWNRTFTEHRNDVAGDFAYLAEKWTEDPPSDAVGPGFS